MGSPYVSPLLFLMDGLEKLLGCYKTFTVRNKPEFIRPVTEHIDQESAETVDLDLVIAFGQKGIP
jgi:hypothetical protein